MRRRDGCNRVPQWLRARETLAVVFRSRESSPFRFGFELDQLAITRYGSFEGAEPRVRILSVLFTPPSLAR